MSLNDVVLQYFAEVDNPKRFSLPIFGNLGRSASISQVNQRPSSVPSGKFAGSRSGVSQSTFDLSRSPQEGKPIFMPEANRRQRRKSLVSAIFSRTPFILIVVCFLNLLHCSLKRVLERYKPT